MRRDTKYLLFLFVGFSILLAGIALYVALMLNRTLYLGEVGTPEQLAMLSFKQEIVERFSAIFLTVVTVLAALAGIMGVGAYRFLRQKIEKDLEAAIVHRVGIAQAWSICATYNEAAYAQWREYEPFLQEHLAQIGSGQAGLQGEDKEKALGFLDLADDMINSGRSTISELSDEAFRYYVREKSRLKAYVNLLNGCIYAATSRILIENRAPSAEMVEELDNYATELKEFALGELLATDNYRWWESIETIGFYEYHLGRILGEQTRQARGARMLKSLRDGVKFRSYLDKRPEGIGKQIEREYTANGFSLDL